MCGIAGYIGYTPLPEQNIKKTLNVMYHRGPDDSGYVCLKEGTSYISLLHTRLSIIDLDHRSKQPFCLNGYQLIFNGEIYNYLELKERLGPEAVWETTSDTEVLLKYYLIYGESCLQFFEGMWSFAIYDPKKREVFLARDRFAEKPLYYFETESGFYFASEIKFIKELYDKKIPIDLKQVNRYMVNGYKSLFKKTETFYAGVKNLPYASQMAVNLKLKKKIKKYWEPKTSVVEMSIEDAIKGFKERLLQSMELRLRADVPIAFCLSGGVDSAALASIAAKEFGYDVMGFSLIDQDERYNELENINATVNDLNCRSELIQVSSENFIPQLETLVKYHDGPVATISYYIHSMISREVARKGFKVVFSGTAADELVTGYYDHFLLHLAEMKPHSNYATYLKGWKEKVLIHTRNPLLQDPDLYVKKPDFREHVYYLNHEFSGLLKQEFYEEFEEVQYCDSLLRKRMLNELFHEATPLILHEDDKNSMMYSIENRSPYLDKSLFEFSYCIPPEHLIRDGVSKYVLREAVRGILNDQVRCDTKKKGFNASLQSLFDINLEENKKYLMEDGPLFDIIDKHKLNKYIKGKSSLPNSLSKYIFNILNTKIFLEQNT